MTPHSERARTKFITVVARKNTVSGTQNDIRVNYPLDSEANTVAFLNSWDSGAIRYHALRRTTVKTCCLHENYMTDHIDHIILQHHNTKYVV